MGHTKDDGPSCSCESGRKSESMVTTFCFFEFRYLKVGSVFEDYLTPATKNPRNDADHFVIGDELESSV